ncbi:MAG: uncharacterized protein KVP18_005120 [Porospora cf. gigantea A]|uniref:uncharacterized protein n=1 Tax=Porospora cf. gigantea A TaxID=2853593 RepID=UPI003559CA7E|nr:MAG: hypothetical protein KVP18_005120 [Porospora cf. gigantea A]
MGCHRCRRKTFDAIPIAADWMGYIAGYTAMLLGFLHIFTTDAHLSRSTWGETFDDPNKEVWRDRMFSLAPSIVADVWAGVVLGAITVESYHETPLKLIRANFVAVTAWQLFVVLFGVIGYLGNLGLVMSLPGLFASATALFCVTVLKAAPTLHFASVVSLW